MKIRKLGADSLDSLYTALKKCSRLCRRLPRAEHHTDGEHACDARCGPLRDHRTLRPLETGHGDSVPVGQAELASVLACSFLADLWDYRPFRGR